MESSQEQGSVPVPVALAKDVPTVEQETKNEVNKESKTTASKKPVFGVPAKKKTGFAAPAKKDSAATSDVTTKPKTSKEESEIEQKVKEEKKRLLEEKKRLLEEKKKLLEGKKRAREEELRAKEEARLKKEEERLTKEQEKQQKEEEKLAKEQEKLLEKQKKQADKDAKEQQKLEEKRKKEAERDAKEQEKKLKQEKREKKIREKSQMGNEQEEEESGKKVESLDNDEEAQAEIEDEHVDEIEEEEAKLIVPETEEDKKDHIEENAENKDSHEGKPEKMEQTVDSKPKRQPYGRSLSNQEYEAIFDAVFERYPPVSSQELQDGTWKKEEEPEDDFDAILKVAEELDVSGGDVVDAERFLQEIPQDLQDEVRAQLTQFSNEETPYHSEIDSQGKASPKLVTPQPPKLQKKKTGSSTKKQQMAPKNLDFTKERRSLDMDAVASMEKKKHKHRVSKKEVMTGRTIETAGTWVQCSSTACHKWRYLPDVVDPSQLPETWLCSMNSDVKYAMGGCSKPEQEFNQQEHDVDYIFTKYTEGSVVWAKMAGYPWWPAMVEMDPDEDLFFECQKEHNVPSRYHVVFFDERVSRAWVRESGMKPFTGKETVSSMGSCKVKGHDYRTEISLARTLAQQALKMPLEQRITKYSFCKRYEGKWGKCETDVIPRTHKELHKKKKQRKSETTMRAVEVIPEVSGSSQELVGSDPYRVEAIDEDDEDYAPVTTKAPLKRFPDTYSNSALSAKRVKLESKPKDSPIQKPPIASKKRLGARGGVTQAKPEMKFDSDIFTMEIDGEDDEDKNGPMETVTEKEDEEQQENSSHADEHREARVGKVDISENVPCTHEEETVKREKSTEEWLMAAGTISNSSQNNSEKGSKLKGAAKRKGGFSAPVVVSDSNKMVKEHENKTLNIVKSGKLRLSQRSHSQSSQMSLSQNSQKNNSQALSENEFLKLDTVPVKGKGTKTQDSPETEDSPPFMVDESGNLDIPASQVSAKMQFSQDEDSQPFEADE